MSEVSSRVNSALDFQGLGELRGQAQRDQRAALRETARQFEAMFLQNVMATMREATFKSDLLESSAMETFQSMHDKEIALSMTRRGGVGFADMLVNQMERNQMVPAAEALAARQSGEAMRLPTAAAAAPSAGGALPLDPKRPSLPIQSPDRAFDLPRRPGDRSFLIHRGIPLKPSRGPDR